MNRPQTVLLPALTLVAAAGVASAQCTPPLIVGTPGPLAANPGPNSVASADFNLDGYPDFAVTAEFGGTIQVFTALPVAAGSPPAFAAPAALSGTPAAYAAIVARDLNGDGRPDLAVADVSTARVVVYYNSPAPAAAGTFLPPVAVPMTTQTYFLTAADYNLDGFGDLAAQRFTGGLSYALTSGPSSYSAPGSIGGGANGAGIAAGDVNGDGRQDIISVRTTGTLDMGINGAAPGSFGYVGQALTVVGTVTGLAAADFNGDGRADVALTETGSGSSGGVRIFLATGNAAAPYQTAGAFYLTGSTASAVATADLNGDGRPDLLVTNKGAGTVSVLMGRADGTFNAASPFTLGGQPVAVAPIDLLGDGMMDFVTVSQTPAQYTLVRNAPFAQQPQTQTAVVGGSASFTIGQAPAGSNIRWRRNGQPLNDGASVSGATTGTLTVSSLGALNAGDVYDALVTGPCGVIRSEAAALRIADTAGCLADIGEQGGTPGHDGVLDNNDFIVFIDYFFNGTGCQ